MREPEPDRGNAAVTGDGAGEGERVGGIGEEILVLELRVMGAVMLWLPRRTEMLAVALGPPLSRVRMPLVPGARV